MKSKIDEGIIKDETGYYVFDKKFDEITDIIKSCTDIFALIKQKSFQ